MLITGAAAGFPERYGGDGRFTDGFLRCRTGGQLLTTVTAGNTTLTAASLTGITAPAGLPGPPLLTPLLREACLLSTALLADLSGEAEPSLQAALELALQGSPQGVYSLGGQPPSPVGVNWWAPGQWLPIFACWSVQYLPLHPTGYRRRTGQLPRHRHQRELPPRSGRRRHPHLRAQRRAGQHHD